MRRLTVACAVAALVVCAGALSANAQITRGAATLPGVAQNYSPIEKAACGGRRGACPPFRHRVCGPRGRCWCAPC